MSCRNGRLAKVDFNLPIVDQYRLPAGFSGLRKRSTSHNPRPYS